MLSLSKGLTKRGLSDNPHVFRIIHTGSPAAAARLRPKVIAKCQNSKFLKLIVQ